MKDKCNNCGEVEVDTATCAKLMGPEMRSDNAGNLKSVRKVIYLCDKCVTRYFDKAQTDYELTPKEVFLFGVLGFVVAALIWRWCL